jgi:hypothetical protein
MSITEGKKFEAKDASELASFYGVPKPLMNAMFVELGGVAYPKESALLYVGHKKGIQRIEVSRPVADEKGEWSCEAKIYPILGLQKLQEVNRLPPELKGRTLEYLTAPTVEWGHASKENVKMSTMQAWLPEMAIKRAVCRALRLFAGSFGTSYEELPEAELSQDELKSAADKGKQVQAVIA